jgi:glutathione S-transferase
VRKVCVAAAEKGLPYEMKLTSPNSRDPEFVAASPFGKIPALRLGTFTLCDSSAIIAWMEAEHPTPALLPADPRQRGRAVWFDEFADTLLGGATLKILFNRFVGPKLLKLPGNEALAAEGEAELPRLLGWLESVTPPEGWLLGDAFTLADISVAAMLRSLAYVRLEPTAGAYPAIVAWAARVAQRPSWQQIVVEEAARRPAKP